MRSFRISWTEFYCLIAVAVLAAALTAPALRARRGGATCQGNLKQIGITLLMYANENRGEIFPPRSPHRGNWMVDATKLCPDYLDDVRVFLCPASPYASEDTFTLRSTWQHPTFERGTPHPDCVSSLFYNYTGYLLNGDEPALAFYLAWEASGGRVDELREPLPLPRWEHSDWSPPGAGSPVLWDRVPTDLREISHTAPGIHVLHQDGSVAFVAYSPLNTSSNFPATRLSAELFGSSVPELPSDCR